jgi:hypothetical protein
LSEHPTSNELLASAVSKLTQRLAHWLTSEESEALYAEFVRLQEKAPALEPQPVWREPATHCQNGGAVCLAGNADGICCPDDSCDIDDGLKARDPRIAQPPGQVTDFDVALADYYERRDKWERERSDVHHQRMKWAQLNVLNAAQRLAQPPNELLQYELGFVEQVDGEQLRIDYHGRSHTMRVDHWLDAAWYWNGETRASQPPETDADRDGLNQLISELENISSYESDAAMDIICQATMWLKAWPRTAQPPSTSRYQVGDYVNYLGVNTRIAEVGERSYRLWGGSIALESMLSPTPTKSAGDT